MIRHDSPIVFLPDSLFPQCNFRVSLLSLSTHVKVFS